MYEDSLLDFLYTNRISYERMVFVNPKFHVNRVPGPCNAGTSSWVDHLTTSAQVHVPIFRQQLSYSFRSHICCKKAIHYTEGTCSYFQTAALVQLPLSHLLQKGNPLHTKYAYPPIHPHPHPTRHCVKKRLQVRPWPMWPMRPIGTM